MTASTRRERRALALSLLGLAAFLVWQAFALRAYQRINRRPPSWDQAIQLDIALDYREALAAGRWAAIWTQQHKSGMPPFPPLYHLALTKAYDFPDPAAAALWLNWFYLAVLCVSLFGLAREFLPDSSALAAAVIFACTPLIQDLYANQLIDLAVVAWAAAAYWSLVRAKGFSRWRPSLVFALLFAVGMLHKFSFFSYLIPAYLVALRALADPARRPQVLAAAALAGALSAPWYLEHAFRLLPILVQGSADYAVPFWKHGAFFAYFLTGAHWLGPLFWALGYAGLLRPRYARMREQGWLITAWALTSYVFWAIVPNRQPRYLAPGLPALAVAAVAAWPRELVWVLAAVQLASGANYLTGAVNPVSLPMPWGQVRFFVSSPPSPEDWHLAEILREAERRADSSRTIANLTLVANAPYFNAATLTWTAHWLGLSHIRVRGVNRRLCELSEFVLLKEGDLGPAGVISGLPEAAGAVQDAKGWFARAYAPAGRWPLPDGSTAVLYQQKKPASAPESSTTLSFRRFSAGTLEAERLRIDLGRWDRAAGAYPHVRLTAPSLSLRGLPLRGLDLELAGLRFIPIGAAGGAWKDLRLLRLRELTLRSVSVDAEALRRYLEARIQGLAVARLDIDHTLRVAARLRGLPLYVELAPRILEGPRRLHIEVVKLRVAGLPLPTGPFNHVKEMTLFLEPSPDTPFIIRAPGLTLSGGRLSIP